MQDVADQARSLGSVQLNIRVVKVCVDQRPTGKNELVVGFLLRMAGPPSGCVSGSALTSF